MLSMIPKGGRLAEIGVFAGDFSRELLDHCNPRELVLVDLWGSGQIMSGDVNGANVRVISGDELERRVRERFAGFPEVKVMKGDSRVLKLIRAEGFDAVYVDADHRYEGVRRDLLAAFRVLKPGGLLMGHDYEIDPAKAGQAWQFGVRDAVDDFCRDYRQKIVALSRDGCASFAIEVDKGPTTVGWVSEARSLSSLWNYRMRRALRRFGVLH